MSPLSTAAPARAFSVELPENWFEFDVWRATRTGDLARLVDRRVAEHPELAPLRARLVQALRDVAAQAERAGVVWAAALADPWPDKRFLTATAFVAVAEPDPGLAGDEVEVIAARIPAQGDGASSRRRRVALGEVPAGRCVQVWTVSPGGPGLPPAASLQTLVPQAGRVVNLVLSTPHVHLAEPFFGVFEAAAATLTFR